MDKKRIKSYIEVLAERYNLSRYPVNLSAWLRVVGADIKPDEFDDKLSGFAYQKNGVKIIGVNKKHPLVRQRFTTAHELGHIFLHKNDAVSYDTASILLRMQHSSASTDPKEIEANFFAAELLMPEENIRADIDQYKGIDLEDKQTIRKLAAKYKVSSQAMTIRLSSLYFG